MSALRDIAVDLAARIVATTVDTTYAGVSAYRQSVTHYTAEDVADLPGRTRLFLLQDTGRRDPEPPLGRNIEWSALYAYHEVAIAYLQGTDAWELERVVGEDLDRLKNALELADNYPTTPTGISRRVVSDATLTREPAAGGTLFLRFTVGTYYLPTF